MMVGRGMLVNMDVITVLLWDNQQCNIIIMLAL